MGLFVMRLSIVEGWISAVKCFQIGPVKYCTYLKFAEGLDLLLIFLDISKSGRTRDVLPKQQRVEYATLPSVIIICTFCRCAL